MVRRGGTFESEETSVERLDGIAELSGVTGARLEHLLEHQSMRRSHVQVCGFATCEYPALQSPKAVHQRRETLCYDY